MIAGIVSAVAAVALIAFAVLGKRRRDAKQKAAQPSPIPPADDDDDNLEQGPDQPHDVHSLAPAVLAVGRGGDELYSQQRTPTEADEVCGRDIVPPSAPVMLAGPLQSSTEHAANAVEDQSPPHSTSPHRQTPAEADGIDDGGIVPPSAPPSLAGRVQSSTEDAAQNGGAGVIDKDAEDSSAEATTPSIATASTGNISTVESAELAEFPQRQSVADAASAAGGSRPEAASGGDTGASSAAERRSSDGDIGLSRAVLAAAQELAHSCQVPGVSEAAGVLCIMANLFTDSRENDKASDVRLRQCRSIVMALKRADKVVGKVSAEPCGGFFRLFCVFVRMFFVSETYTSSARFTFCFWPATQLYFRSLFWFIISVVHTHAQP